MSNIIKKEFSQDIEKELEDFNNNFSPKKEFSQDENKKNFDHLEYDEKNQRITQKEQLFDWIINICNKFLIGVSLVFCMFMFEIKEDFMVSDKFFNLLFIIFIITILCSALLLNFGKGLYKFFFEVELFFKLKKSKEEKIEEKVAKATMRLIEIVFYTTAITFFYFSINKIFIVREDVKEVQSIIIALITSTTSTVIGLPAIVAMAIFRSEKDKKKENESKIFD
jgi:hypothetical protein